jgi:hypothetical protein
MPPGAPAPPKPITKEWRKWEGVNVRDSRTAIGDTEFAWLENAITIGAGAIQILPKEGASVATLSQGIASLWGFVLQGLPVMMAVGLDGSLTQVSPFGTVVVAAAAGTLSTSATLTIWQGGPLLIIDPTKGYFSWDGTTFTVLDATQKGEHIAVFQGHVWISKGRAITFTAPNSYTDMNPGHGAGTANITDEAFQGNIFAMASALEQLWIVGASAVEALSNVQAIGTSPFVSTSFSISNVVSSVGSQFSASVLGYFRALVFASPFGVYALSGVTPQKISEKLDDFPFGPQLGPVPDVPAAIAVVQNTLAVLFLVSYAGTQAQSGLSPVPLIAGFVQGKWFFASQGDLTWITTVNVGGVAQAWGTDGTHIYQLFGSDTCTEVSYKVQSKLYDFGSAVTEKGMLKLGVELRAQPSVTVQQLLCILNNPILGGTEWTLEGDTRANLTRSTASVFLDDLTVYAFHWEFGVAIYYDVSVDGGQTFPVVHTTSSASFNDVVVAKRLVLADGTTRFLVLLNDNQAVAYSDNVLTLPNTSTWTRLTPPGSGGAPIGLEVNGLNVVVAGQDGAANLQMAYSVDGGATFLASTTMPAESTTTSYGYQVLTSPSAGVWCFISPTSGKIFRSTDSGDHWGAAVATLPTGDASLPKVACIFAASATRVVACFQGQVATSDDAGVTWTLRQNLTLPASSPVHVKQGGIGWIASFGAVSSPPVLGGATNYATAFDASTTRGAMWRSVDLGTTWTIVDSVGGGLVSTNPDTRITALVARNGRGVIDIWNSGTTHRNTWHALAVAGTPVCMTLINNAGAPLTIVVGTVGGCPPQPFSPTLTADSERQSVVVPVYGTSGVAFLVNNAGLLLTLVNNVGDPLTLISGGLSLSKSDAKMFGHYLGWTLQGTDPPFRIETVEMEVVPTREWDTTP